MIAQLFNPDRFISELAAKIIYKLNKKLFLSALERLDKQTRKEFSTLPLQGTRLIFEKIDAIKNIQIFETLPESLIVELFELSN